jgi:hypothetical protein
MWLRPRRRALVLVGGISSDNACYLNLIRWRLQVAATGTIGPLPKQFPHQDSLPLRCFLCLQMLFDEWIKDLQLMVNQ